MPHKSYKNMITGSIEDASILRKFTVLFLLMSIIPLCILYYFYVQLSSVGSIEINAQDFNLTLTLVVLGVIVGYFTMRSVLKKIIDLTNANRKALESVLSPEKLKELGDDKNEISVLAKSFSVITERLEENVRSLELAKKTLHAVMNKVGQGISSMQNIDSFLELILETITEGLSGRIGVLMILNEARDTLVTKTVYGAVYNPTEPLKIKIQEGTIIQSILKSKSPLALSGADVEFTNVKEYAFLFKVPMICSPLVVRDRVCGIITISGKINGHGFEEEELNLLYSLSTQTAIAVENARLSKDMEQTYFETISALALAVDAKDKYSRGHLDRVSLYCARMADKLGLDENDKNVLRDAARLHDIGKIGIPDEVLRKEGPLNDQEWVLMRKHPEIGESIIKPVRSLGQLCDLIRHHHEKLDGTGYPDRLKGDEITPLVRVLTIIDIFDALTTDRPYRDKMSIKEACQKMRQMKDQIDQDIVEVFIETLEKE